MALLEVIYPNPQHTLDKPIGNSNYFIVWMNQRNFDHRTKNPYPWKQGSNQAWVAEGGPGFLYQNQGYDASLLGAYAPAAAGDAAADLLASADELAVDVLED